MVDSEVRGSVGYGDGRVQSEGGGGRGTAIRKGRVVNRWKLR